jgi:hypothetical protein
LDRGRARNKGLSGGLFGVLAYQNRTFFSPTKSQPRTPRRTDPDFGPATEHHPIFMIVECCNTSRQKPRLEEVIGYDPEKNSYGLAQGRRLASTRSSENMRRKRGLMKVKSIQHNRGR